MTDIHISHPRSAGQLVLPPGVYASRLPNGRETTSCYGCRWTLSSADSFAEARALGIECSMYGTDFPAYCWRRSKGIEGRRP